MDILGKILGSKKVIEGGMSALDKVVFTNEERADQKIKLLEAYQPFKINLRLLSLIVAIPYVLMVLTLFGMSAFGLSIVAGFALLKDTLTIPFLAIMSLYFADGVGFMKARRKDKK